MNFEAKKIQLEIFNERISISDRMPIKVLDILIFIVLISAIAIFILDWIGIIYALVFSLGYVLFRYFAWIIWRKIEVNLESEKLTITNMVFNKTKRTKIITNKFDYSNLSLNEFEQSGMKRAMIQYKSHKLIDLLLLTHPDDIELVKRKLFNRNET